MPWDGGLSFTESLCRGFVLPFDGATEGCWGASAQVTVQGKPGGAEEVAEDKRYGDGHGGSWGIAARIGASVSDVVSVTTTGGPASGSGVRRTVSA